ncbi:DUF2267 domain-containing protein [Pseudonocardia kunmingensis]|uniref:Uncharacterized protein (DUF2267 family) n=1 Tax=Pseudonocardia kunmingensis TaxID=630975 RepID=A0A543CX91_9PSEU|nr:DUF2267 domain-containing protein [Pseudonocardia kunmingensis]TQM01724.1 uncharacterized protein (DUF2267 family) [Pseudonocardia kunmingensis]
MQQHELVAAVADGVGAGKHDAERGVRCTLQVLGRRLAGGQTRNLAAQLPSDLATVLPADGPGERFDVEEFYRRVAEAEGGSWTPQQARRHARATLAALKAGLTGHEYDHLAAQLPPDYADLLSTESVQHH